MLSYLALILCRCCCPSARCSQTQTQTTRLCRRLHTSTRRTGSDTRRLQGSGRESMLWAEGVGNDSHTSQHRSSCHGVLPNAPGPLRRAAELASLMSSGIHRIKMKGGWLCWLIPSVKGTSQHGTCLSEATNQCCAVNTMYD